VQKVISAVVALFVVLGSLPAFAQASPSSEASRKAELVAAWQAASAAGAAGPKDVSLIDQAALKLPAGHFFVPQAEGAASCGRSAMSSMTQASSALSSARGRMTDGSW